MNFCLSLARVMFACESICVCMCVCVCVCMCVYCPLSSPLSIIRRDLGVSIMDIMLPVRCRRLFRLQNPKINLIHRCILLSVLCFAFAQKQTQQDNSDTEPVITDRQGRIPLPACRHRSLGQGSLPACRHRPVGQGSLPAYHC